MFNKRLDDRTRVLSTMVEMKIRSGGLGGA